VIYSIGSVPGVIVVVVIICIVNYYCPPIPSMIRVMMVVVVMAINTHSHHRKSCKIGRIIPVVIGRSIGHIGG